MQGVSRRCRFKLQEHLESVFAWDSFSWHWHVWMYMDPARLQRVFANAGRKVTTADVYPASLCGLSDYRREP
jgi:hypothetical protein